MRFDTDQESRSRPEGAIEDPEASLANCARPEHYTVMTQPAASSRLLLLALDTDDMATATSGLCVLPANLQVVVVADTALAASFTETLQVRTVGRGYGIDQNVHVFARFKIIVTIKHPGWNAVGEGPQGPS